MSEGVEPRHVHSTAYQILLPSICPETWESFLMHYENRRMGLERYNRKPVRVISQRVECLTRCSDSDLALGSQGNVPGLSYSQQTFGRYMFERDGSCEILRIFSTTNYVGNAAVRRQRTYFCAKPQRVKWTLIWSLDVGESEQPNICTYRSFQWIQTWPLFIVAE